MVNRNSWARNRLGMGRWEHSGQVAIAGWGQSPIQRRWDGKSTDSTLGAYCMLAVQRALEDAGLTMDDVDGLITSPETRVGDTWAPRPYLDPPYDSEDGITICSAEWLNTQMGGFKNVKYIESNAPTMPGPVTQAIQAVGDGQADVIVAWYSMGNLEGRYEHGGQNATDYARGNSAFAAPWGYQSGAQMNNLMVYKEYCHKYNYPEDGALAPFAVNQRRNGLLTPWSYYALHEPYQITEEDYLASRYVSEPLRVLDCDRPVVACAAFVITSAERARSLKQPPVYVINHASRDESGRSTMTVLAEQQSFVRNLAQQTWEGSGLGPEDIDVFNAYDGYLTFTQQFLEGFQWHGVKEGEALDFYKEDLRVEGPHPYLSSGGNNGTGRTRTALLSDCIEQLRGQAGERQIQIRCETALFVGLAPGSASTITLTKEPM